MIFNFRFLGSCLMGIIVTLVGMFMLGLNLTAAVQLTSLLIVLGCAIGLLYVFKDPAAIHAAFRALFFCSSSVRTVSSAISVLETLEKTSFIGGVVGAVLGLIHATVNFNSPEQIGPGIVVSLDCLLYGFMLNAFLVIPAKQALLAPGRSDQSSTAPQQHMEWEGMFGFLGGMALVAMGFILEGGNINWYLSFPSMVIVVSPVIASYFSRSTQQQRPDLSTVTRGWYSDAVVCGAMIATVFHVIGIMHNLEHTEAIPWRLAASMLPLLYGFIGAIILRHGNFTAKSFTLLEGTNSRYFAFSALTIVALTICSAEVFLAIHFYG